MAQAHNNEEEFYDAAEYQPLEPLPELPLLLEQPLELTQPELLIQLAQPKQQRPKIIKKKLMATPVLPNTGVLVNNVLVNKVLHQPEPKHFTIKDVEYLDYKMQLFGNKEPDRTDKYCEFYLCNDIQQIKYFTKNIKEYALNTNLSDEHITSIVKKINRTKELYFVNPIAVIEYINESTNTPKDLIEIVDGHHRLKCLRKLINNSQYDEISFTFWVQVYKCANQKDADDLFRKYNTSKPFPINLDLTDLITLIIEKLNRQFNKTKFEFIKNTMHRANRPSICKKEFAEKIKDRLEDQLRTTGKYDYNDISIDNIITKFINYNDSLISETLEWFNKKSSNGKSDSGKITENIYKKAKDNKCVLGLLSLEELINVCVCL